MNDLAKFTEKELTAELAKREKDRVNEELKIRTEKFMQLAVNKDALLDIVDHSRTSCSDAKVSNGFFTGEYGPRCTRCALLELRRSDASIYAEEFDVEVTVSFRKITR